MWRRVGMLKTIERQRPWKEEKCCHSHHYHRRYRWRSLKRWMWHLLHTLVCHMKPFSHSQDSAWRFWPLKEVCQMYICLNFLLTLLLLSAIGSQPTPSSAWNTRTSTSTLLLRILRSKSYILLFNIAFYGENFTFLQVYLPSTELILLMNTEPFLPRNQSYIL